MKTMNGVGGKKDITIIDVAKKAGVSQATVGRVIGGYGSVSEKTRKKVKKTIKELNYVPNAIAQSMKSKNTNTIGLIVGNVANSFFGEIAKSIDAVCTENHYNVIISNTGESIEGEINALKTLYSKRIDGLIIATAQRSNVILDDKIISLYTGSVPVVYIDSEIFSIDELCVKTDHFGGANKGTNYLLEKGHTKIGIITGLQTSPMEQRVDGYRKALENHGIEFKPEYVRFGNVIAIEEGRLCTKDLLEKNKELTAIFPLNNLLCIGALLAINELGLRIPDDISVIGWDDFALANILNPPLTVIAQDTNRIGKLAAEKLFEVMREEQADAFGEKRITLGMQLIERGSCAQPRKHTIL